MKYCCILHGRVRVMWETKSIRHILVNFIASATQRLIYKKAVKDYQQANGVDFTGRFINSLAFTTPYIVYWQEIGSPAAQAKSQSK